MLQNKQIKEIDVASLFHLEFQIFYRFNYLRGSNSARFEHVQSSVRSGRIKLKTQNLGFAASPLSSDIYLIKTLFA